MSKTMRHNFNVKENYDKETANSFYDKNITVNSLFIVEQSKYNQS